MLRSMYSGIAGMKNFQTKLDVIGNNIANVNTAGFKKGRITFQDMLSQTSQGATAPGATSGTVPGDGSVRGGINPKQVGTGSKIGSIDTIHTQGFMQTTGGTLDLMVQGDGMFVVRMGKEAVFTRAGNFNLDGSDATKPSETEPETVPSDSEKSSFLVNSDGYKVLDSTGKEIAIPKDAESISVQQNGKITFIIGNKTYTTKNPIALANVPNPGGLEKVGGSLYRDTPNTGFKEGTGDDKYDKPGNGGTGDIISGTLEMSNVDLSEEFTEMITAQRAFQANTRIITTSDEILQELVNLKR